jgi:hypothetical protein
MLAPFVCLSICAVVSARRYMVTRKHSELLCYLQYATAQRIIWTMNHYYYFVYARAWNCKSIYENSRWAMTCWWRITVGVNLPECGIDLPQITTMPTVVYQHLYNEYMGYHNRITKLMEWCQQFTTKTFTRMAICLTCNYVQFTSIQYTYWTNTVSLVMHRKSQATLLWYSEMFTLLLYAWSCWEHIFFSLCDAPGF